MNNNDGALSFDAIINMEGWRAALVQMQNDSLNLSNRVVADTKKMDAGFSKLGVAIGGYLSLSTGKQFLSDIVSVRGEFQKIEALLTNSKGSAVAQSSLGMISEYAAKTPFQLSELGNSFEKLSQDSLLTMGELTKLGDLAAYKAKGFDQLTEAILDAETGEFERLKEFGIRASKEGDNVTFTFRGVETQVKLASKSIREYLVGLGEMAGVSGSAAAISKTLVGQVSNLEDAWDRMLNKIGQSNQDILSDGIAGAASLIDNYETVGKVLTALIATYGTYKAALITTTALQASQSVTYGTVTAGITAESGAIAQNIANKLANAQSTAALTAAIAEQMAVRAEDAAFTAAEIAASEEVVRSEFREIAAKEALAAETVKLTALKVVEAEANLANAVAYQETAAFREKDILRMRAARNVEIAQNELAAASQTHLAATKASEAAANDVNIKKVLVDTAAKNTNTAATVANTASTAAKSAALQAEVAAANAATLSSTRLSVATQIQTAAQRAFNVVASANPYVLLTTAVVGLVAAYWALSESTDAQTEAQDALNKASEDAKKYREETIQQITSLNSVMRDETSTAYQKVIAYQQLQSQFPALLKNISLQEYLTKNANEVQKQFNESLDQTDLSNLQEEYIKTVESINKLSLALENYNSATSTNSKDDLSKSLEIARIKAGLLEDQIDAVKVAVSKATDEQKLSLMTDQEKIKYLEQQRDELEIQKSSLENNLVLSKKIGSEFKAWDLTGAIVSLANLGGRISDISSKLAAIPGYATDEMPRNKDYFENQKKSAQSSLDALPLNSKGQFIDQVAANKEIGIINEANKSLEKFNVTASKTRSGSSKDEIFPSGSVAEFDRQIKKAEEALSRLNPNTQLDRVKALQDSILMLTKQRAEAEKLVEVRTFEDTLSAKRAEYQKYEAALETGYDTGTVKGVFAKLLEGGQSYADFLNKQILPLGKQLREGTIDNSGMEQLLQLTVELDNVMGRSSSLDLFKNKLHELKGNTSSLTELVGALNQELASLGGDTSTGGIAMYNYAKDLRAETKSQLNTLFKNFLTETNSFDKKRKQIDDKYFDLLAKANEELQGKQLDQAKKRIEKQHDEELSKMLDAQFMQSDIYKKLNKEVLYWDQQQLKSKIAIIQKALKEEKLSIEMRQQLEGELAQKQNELTEKNAEVWYSIAGSIGQIGSSLNGSGGFLGELGSAMSGLSEGMGQLISTFKQLKQIQNSGGKVSAGDAIGAAVQGVGNLISLNVQARKRRKAERAARDLDSISYQVEMNRLLNEEIRLRTILNENVYFKDYAGRIQDAIGGATDAVVKYQKALENLIDNGKAFEGLKPVVDWSNVGAGAATGASAGAVVGAAVGYGVGAIVGAVVGGIIGGVVGLFSKKNKEIYDSLLSIHPQLIDANGELNTSLAETLIATNQLDDKTKLWVQDLINASEALKEARQQITDIVAELTGGMGPELRDALVEAFVEGEDAAVKFGETVESTLENALKNLIYSAVFSKAFTKLQHDLELALVGNGTSFQQVFASFLGQSQELTKQFNEMMEAAVKEGKKFGFDLFAAEADIKDNSSLSAIQKAITEESANILIGQNNGIRINTAEANDIMRNQLFHLASIDRNTARLESIEYSLRMISNQRAWRDQGIQ